MRKLLCALMTLSLLALFSSCEKDETNMTCSVEYDFRLPDLLVELFDAYVEYTDNGQTHTEMMKDGKWSKNFSYKWEGDKTNHASSG